MSQLRTFPPRCALDAITAAAVNHCDAIDGVRDGVISAPGLCEFSPFRVVGETVLCDDRPVKISKNASLVVKKTWEGMRAPDGTFSWYGIERDTPLVLCSSGKPSIAGTSCSTPFNCTGFPFELAADWISRFMLEDPFADLLRLSHVELTEIFARSNSKYGPLIATNNPDLSTSSRPSTSFLAPRPRQKATPTTGSSPSRRWICTRGMILSS